MFSYNDFYDIVYLINSVAIQLLGTCFAAENSQKKQRPVVGVQLPETKPGARKSTPFNKSTWKAAAQGNKKNGEAFISKVDGEKNWRKNYIKYVCDHMRLCDDADTCLEMARSGLDFLYGNLEYFRNEGEQAMSMADAMNNPIPDKFETGLVETSCNKAPARELTIPYNGKTLSGSEAEGLVKRWGKDGVVEDDTAEILVNLLNTDMSANLDDKVFVLLGGLSEMGPLQRLLSYGATVVAIDFHAARLQKRLLDIAQDFPGQLILPLKPGSNQLSQNEKWADNAGCDLLRDFPEIADWLSNLMPERQMVIGSYCYLDGEMFIKIVAAMDAICTTVTERRSIPTVLAYLATPTDCHMVRNECVQSAKAQTQSGFGSLMGCFTTSKCYSNNDMVDGMYFTNSVVNEQGPNYCLAKRLQTWRIMLHQAAGFPVSINVAPTTATVSVVKNWIFKFSLEGMPSFKPMEIYQTETTKSVMTALLLNDVLNGNPECKHPLQVISTGQVHGGMYRTGLDFCSLGTPAFLTAAIKRYFWIFLIVLAVLGYVLFG